MGKVVDCRRHGVLIRTCEFPIVETRVPLPEPKQRDLEEECNSLLTRDRLAFAPYDGITFPHRCNRAYPCKLRRDWPGRGQFFRPNSRSSSRDRREAGWKAPTRPMVNRAGPDRCVRSRDQSKRFGSGYSPDIGTPVKLSKYRCERY